ncbi:MAG: hypothetical protein DRR08_09735 [Candidatus Parabeggiatoa sp. nov. 2]|nr:MAG: hypothetical protein B6247_17895 [Beggiatoa sp. 4572_84]RKZ61072.1 MAG: hypothetical protein DRR08_09735 [Gammaproteobacteria bacterium]
MHNMLSSYIINSISTRNLPDKKSKAYRGRELNGFLLDIMMRFSSRLLWVYSSSYSEIVIRKLFIALILLVCLTDDHLQSDLDSQTSGTDGLNNSAKSEG